MLVAKNGLLFVLTALAPILGCEPSRSDAPAAEYGPFPLPTELGIPIQQVKNVATANVRQDDALDEEDRWVARGSQWRSRSYVLGTGLAVNVTYRYRAEDGKVWAISVRHAAGKYAGRLGPVNFDMKIADLEASLGRPALRHTIAPVLDEYVWKRDETQFVVEAYSKTYDDIAQFASKGDISSVLAYSTNLGPPGFLGYDASHQR